MTERVKIQPRGGIDYDWQHWSLVYRKRLLRLKKLICAEGYLVWSGEDGMPCKLEKRQAVGEKDPSR